MGCRSKELISVLQSNFLRVFYEAEITEFVAVSLLFTFKRLGLKLVYLPSNLKRLLVSIKHKVSFPLFGLMGMYDAISKLFVDNFHFFFLKVASQICLINYSHKVVSKSCFTWAW
jgi:hypothetical protein